VQVGLTQQPAELVGQDLLDDGLDRLGVVRGVRGT